MWRSDEESGGVRRVRIRESPYNRILIYVARNSPTVHRSEVAHELGISYWSARYHLERMVVEGILDKMTETIGRTRVICYEIARHKRTGVGSFRFFWERGGRDGAAKKVFRNVDEWDSYRRTKAREFKRYEMPERWVEIIVTVDKPKVVEIEPLYIVKLVIDYSAWSFCYGGLRARRAGKVEFPGEKYWVFGVTEPVRSDRRDDEMFVKITYTDYDYPRNSFTRVFYIDDSVAKQIEGTLRREVVGRVIQICKEEFRWGVPE